MIITIRFRVLLRLSSVPSCYHQPNVGEVLRARSVVPGSDLRVRALSAGSGRRASRIRSASRGLVGAPNLFEDFSTRYLKTRYLCGMILLFVQSHLPKVGLCTFLLPLSWYV